MQYKDLSLEKFVKINLYLQENISTDDFDKRIGLLSIIHDKTEDSLLSMNIEDLKKLMSSINFLFEEAIEDTTYNEYFKLKCRTFRVIKDIKDIKSYQYKDANDLNKDQVNYFKNLHYIISLFLVEYKEIKIFNKIIYRKKLKEQPDIYELSDFINKNMSGIQAHSLGIFFLNYSKNLTRLTLIYSILKMKKMMKKMKTQEAKDQITTIIQKTIIELSQLK